MQVKTRKIKDLTEDPNNARQHDERNKEAVKASLENFGQQKPIVINEEGQIIAGHCTTQAAKELGWEELFVVVSSLEQVGQTAFAVADNRTSELGGWDDEQLQRTLEELASLGMTIETVGFNQSELDSMQQSWPEIEGIADIDYDEKVHENYVVKVVGVSHDDKQAVTDLINETLNNSEYKYKAEAF